MLHKDVLRLLAPIELDGVEQGDREVEGAALDAVQARDLDLLLEMHPDASVELLSSWERVLGLPDPCIGELGTMQERLAAVVAKYVETGGQSRAYFIAVAAALGFTVTISEYRPFQVGVSAVGDPLYGTDWLYAWLVTAPATTITEFAVGISAVGDPLRSWGNELLECAIGKLKPAHTYAVFGYGGITDNLINEVSAWTLIGGCTMAPAGIADPGGHQAYTFTDDSVTAYERADSSFFAYTEGETLYFDAWVKKDTDDTRTIHLLVYGTGGVAVSSFSLRFKTNTGDYATSNSTTATISTPVITDYDGDWWRISFYGTCGNGTTLVNIIFYPARGLVLDSNNAAAVGSATLGMVKLRSSY